MENKGCSSRTFKSLMATQFLGAFNDNIYKIAVSLIVTYSLSESEATTLVSLAAGLFVAPFILFATPAGALADRFSKSRITIWSKMFEVVIMAAALIAFWQNSAIGLLIILFFMGAQSTLFSPAKYGILPEILSEDELSRGNGYLEFWTFLAILLGGAAAGPLVRLSTLHPALPGVVCFTVALIGLVASFSMRGVAAQSPGTKIPINPVKNLLPILRAIRSNRPLYLTLVAISYFWFVGAFVQLNIFLYAKEVLNASELETGGLVTALALGVGLGSIFAGWVSRGKVELGLVPIGAVGMGLFGIMSGVWHTNFSIVCFELFALGFCAGIYNVPLHAFFQNTSPVKARGSYVATCNFVTFSSMFIAALLFFIAKQVVGLSAASLFVLVGCSALVVSLYIVKVLPESLVRCINWLLANSLYRLQVVGQENIPKAGGALIVCNHVSYIDASLLLASIDRPIRFMMYKPIYDSKPINWFAKTMAAIPIAPGKRTEVNQSIDDARKAIESGELVGIFAEGGISRVAHLLPFKRGVEMIMQGLDSPIIPAHLDQVWGSIFSFRGGKFLWKRPKRIPYPVTVSFGKPLASNSSATEVREAVQTLSVDAFRLRDKSSQLLHHSFLRQTRATPLGAVAFDSSGKKISFIAALIAGMQFRNAFAEVSQTNEKFVGVMLPPSIAALIANLGLTMAGKVPVNLNYLAGQQAVDAAIEQCAIRHVVSSPLLLNEIKIEITEKLLNVGALLGSPFSPKQAFKAGLSMILPLNLACKILDLKQGSSSDLATVMFSSGSGGTPKGVMLSHSNIASNIEAIYDVFEINRHDRLLGVLPFFHSFGFTVTLWLPLLTGVAVAYHSNPAEVEMLATIIKRYKLTTILTTPTFLGIYTRKFKPQELEPIKRAIVGAEKLKATIAAAFEKKFSTKPLEGYGCTELSPVAIVNREDFREGRTVQHGAKENSVGHPLPGVAVRVVHPESLESLPADTSGMLLVKGPNVMLGYLNDSEKTESVIQDGWYITGDLAQIDSDGFVTITGRQSRFSKIGGEMVPHEKLEDLMHKILGADQPRCVVSAVPDQRKGERLIVLYTGKLEISELLKGLSEEGVSNLWIPKADSFFRIEELPLLGSGKLDLSAVRKIAEELATDS